MARKNNRKDRNRKQRNFYENNEINQQQRRKQQYDAIDSVFQQSFDSSFDESGKNQKICKQVVLEPRGRNQKAYLKSFEDPNQYIIFGIGPAGTGKTMLATMWAIKQLQDGKIEKIIITRPAVSVDEQHGFLPGGINQKMEPWMLPILDVFAKYYSQTQIRQMTNNKQIEIAPLSFMRGRTFSKSIIIADEMQNATPNQMKMLLTRIGEESKVIVTGDLAQHDRGFEANGLLDFAQRLKKNTKPGKYFGIIMFENSDIQRHPVIEHVLDLYDDESSTNTLNQIDQNLKFLQNFSQTKSENESEELDS